MLDVFIASDSYVSKPLNEIPHTFQAYSIYLYLADISLFLFQAPDSWVTVHNLRQLDGGILDPDDCLLDVADDREQIIAVFDEASKPDGTSASEKSENSSPDIFKVR